MAETRNSQCLALGLLSFAAAALTAVLSRSNADLFRPYFADFSPLLVIALVIALGAASLRVLQSRGQLQVFRGRATLRGVALSAALATLFAVVVIVADFAIRFPEDMNVPLPESLLFYPAIGYVVEILFHALPLALLLLILGSLVEKAQMDRLLSICILLTALIEPAFQAAFEERLLSWSAAFVWVHLLAFNLLQLYLFRHYDFVTMYSFRLVYYIYWHIVWGVLRLEVLF